jgi:hypothetical protein
MKSSLNSGMIQIVSLFAFFRLYHLFPALILSLSIENSNRQLELDLLLGVRKVIFAGVD